MSQKPLANDELLLKLLELHEAGQDPDRRFIEVNVAGFEHFWSKEFSCWMITRMVAGNILPRRMFEGVLTPKGLMAAELLRGAAAR